MSATPEEVLAAAEERVTQAEKAVEAATAELSKARWAREFAKIKVKP